MVSDPTVTFTDPDHPSVPVVQESRAAPVGGGKNAGGREHDANKMEDLVEVDEGSVGDLSHHASQDTIRQRPGTSCAMVTDTESEGGYASACSTGAVVPSSAGPVDPGRLSVFSRRAASKSSSENERRTMTIETEVVPNLCASSTLKADHHARSLRTKASTDTVRASQKPKKRKSRVTVVNANHVPTKSEIYAATITQAVDEVDDTDSDETFVYESNPRSPPRASRSPSMSSVHSTIAGDRHTSHHARTEAGSRYAQGHLGYDDRDREKSQRTHAISGKRSMKFAKNPYDESTQRRHVSHTLSSQHRSLLGEDGPFQRSPRVRPGLERRITSPSSSGPNSPRLSRPGSPRGVQRYGATPIKRERTGNPTSFRPWSLYEDEEEGGSSSERSPFLRRKSSRTYRPQREQSDRTSSLMSGMPFIIIIVCLMLVICVVTAGLLSTSQPLRDVKLVNITNVLVSKQELLLDLVVEAYNPNVLTVTVGQVELSVFAQSPYVREAGHPRSPQDWEAIPGPSADEADDDDGPLAESARATDHQHRVGGGRRRSVAGYWPPWSPGHNESHEPPVDEDSTTLLLGRVYAFDNILTFESRFFNRSVSTASAELRVVKPGDITERGGSETWERVIQHSFELIVRGVIKYSTSGLTRTVRTAEVYRTAHINPAKVEHVEDGDGDGDEASSISSGIGIGIGSVGESRHGMAWHNDADDDDIGDDDDDDVATAIGGRGSISSLVA